VPVKDFGSINGEREIEVASGSSFLLLPHWGSNKDYFLAICPWWWWYMYTDICGMPCVVKGGRTALPTESLNFSRKRN